MSDISLLLDESVYRPNGPWIPDFDPKPFKNSTSSDLGDMKWPKFDLERALKLASTRTKSLK